jgi:hypothetical protein
VDLRDAMNGIVYVPITVRWCRALPKNLPRRSMVHDYVTLSA